MKLQLVTPVGIKRDEDVYEVTLPTRTGEIGVLPGHEPLVTLLEIGVMTVRKKKDDSDKMLEYFAVTSGIVEIDGEKILILADEADEPDDIVENEVKAALERAKKLHSKANTQIDITEAQKLLKRHASQLKVAELRRRHHKNRSTLDISGVKNNKNENNIETRHETK